MAPSSCPYAPSCLEETVWKIAEGVWRALLRRQKSADRDSFDPSWPLSEPPFWTHSEFPNSFERGIPRSSHTGSCIPLSYEVSIDSLPRSGTSRVRSLDMQDFALVFSRSELFDRSSSLLVRHSLYAHHHSTTSAWWPTTFGGGPRRSAPSEMRLDSAYGGPWV